MKFEKDLMPKRGRGRPAKNINSQNLKEGPERNVDVVKVGEEVTYSDNLPEFFNIYKADKWSQRMRIPPSFMTSFDGYVPSIFTLKRTYDKSWKVEAEMIKQDWYLEKGWAEFVQENSVQDGDFLIFSYDGNSSTFFVKLFAINGCRKSVSFPQNLQGHSKRKSPASRSNSRPRKYKPRN